MHRPAVLIFNPAAGRRRAAGLAARVAAALSAGGWDPEPRPTSGPGDATRLAREAAAGGAEAVFALGGDGTAREAAAGLVGGTTALGVLPGGTTNVLAHALGLPARPLAAARALADARARPFDVGLCGATPFLMMVSAGLDAQALAALDPARKARWGKVGIAWQGLAEWWCDGPPEIEWSTGGVRRRASFAAVCNIAHYGGRFKLAPGARWDDGRLDLVTFDRPGRAATLAFAAALAFGRHRALAGVACAAVTEATLDGPPGTFLQVDGDVCAETLPVTVRLAAERLPVLIGGSTPSL